MWGIHEAKLIQQIKKAAKIKLIWQRKEDAEYIASSYWLVKLGATAGTKIRTALFEVFGREAQIGQSLAVYKGGVSENGMDCEKLYDTDKATLDGGLTPIVILKQATYPTLRLVVIGEHLLAIDNEFAEMVSDGYAVGAGANSPIYFGSNREILILPFRNGNNYGWLNELRSLLPGIQL